MPRRYDPERRQRLVDAAIRIVERQGLAGLSHRAVAAEADVPLGSTTYHFASLDDLLGAALRQVNVGWLADFAGWAAGYVPDRPMGEQVTDLVERLLTGGRGQLALEYELYLAGLRNEAVRPLAAECLEEMVRLLAARTGDEATARAAVAFADGLMLQHLLTGKPFRRDEIRAASARLLG